MHRLLRLGCTCDLRRTFWKLSVNFLAVTNSHCRLLFGFVLQTTTHVDPSARSLLHGIRERSGCFTLLCRSHSLRPSASQECPRHKNCLFVRITEFRNVAKFFTVATIHLLRSSSRCLSISDSHAQICLPHSCLACSPYRETSQLIVNDRSCRDNPTTPAALSHCPSSAPKPLCEGVFGDALCPSEVVAGIVVRVFDRD